MPRELCPRSLGRKSPRSSVWGRKSHPQMSRHHQQRKMCPPVVRSCYMPAAEQQTVPGCTLGPSELRNSVFSNGRVFGGFAMFSRVLSRLKSYVLCCMTAPSLVPLQHFQTRTQAQVVDPETSVHPTVCLPSLFW